jgi:tetratricopeptide (TPR) repeat protein
MDDNRLQAYASLIKTLHSCSTTEEATQILQANSHLIDVGFLEIMPEAAEVYAKRGDKNAAARLYYYRGDLLAGSGRINSAIASYDKALEHQPNMAVVWVQKGYLLQQELGKHEEAIICFRRALYYKSGNRSQVLFRYSEK